MTAQQAKDLELLAERTPLPVQPADSAEPPRYGERTPLGGMPRRAQWQPAGSIRLPVAAGIGPFAISDGYCFSGYSPTVQGAIVFMFTRSRILGTPAGIEKCADRLYTGEHAANWATSTKKTAGEISTGLMELVSKYPGGVVSEWNRSTHRVSYRVKNYAPTRVTLESATLSRRTSTYLVETTDLAYEDGTWKISATTQQPAAPRELAKEPADAETWISTPN